MALSPGDTIQIILTVGGVPYVKTSAVGCKYDATDLQDFVSFARFADKMTRELLRDIVTFADETE